MTTLTQVRAINFQGRSIDAKFGPLTVVVGDNMGGKTAVAHAIMVAVLGYIPALGKQAQKTIQVMTPDAKAMDVRAHFSDKSSVTRTFKVSKAGAVSQKVDGNDLSELVHPAQLDFDNFRNAKATDRQRILEGLLAATADSTVFEDARMKIATAALDVQLTFADGWLQKLESDCREVSRFLKQEIDTAARTILQLSGDDVPEAFDAEMIQQVVKRLGELRTEHGRKGEAFDALARQQEEAPERPEGEKITDGDIALAENTAVQAREESNRFNAAWLVYRREMSRADEILKPFEGREREEAKSEPMTREDLNQSNRRIKEKQSLSLSRIATAKANWGNVAEQHAAAEANLETLADSACCPTCGVAGDTFREAVSGLQTQIVNALWEKVEAAKKELAEADEEAQAIADAVVELEKEIEIRRRHEAWQAQCEADAIIAEAAKLKPAVDTVDTDARAQDLEKHSRNVRREANAWVAYNAAVVPTDEQVAEAKKAWQDVAAAIGNLEESHKDLIERQTAWNAHLADKTRLAKLGTENEAREAKRTAADELAGWAKTKSLEITAEAMKPLLTVCNSIMAGLVQGTLAIDGTVVGIRRGEAMLPLEILSGSEATAVTAAIQIALAGNSPLGLVIIDELSRFTPIRKEVFLMNVWNAIQSGIIGQAVFIDHDPRLLDIARGVNASIIEIEG